jgi:hypothetical protein
VARRTFRLRSDLWVAWQSCHWLKSIKLKKRILSTTFPVNLPKWNFSIRPIGLWLDFTAPWFVHLYSITTWKWLESFKDMTNSWRGEKLFNGFIRYICTTCPTLFLQEWVTFCGQKCESDANSSSTCMVSDCSSWDSYKIIITFSPYLPLTSTSREATLVWRIIVIFWSLLEKTSISTISFPDTKGELHRGRAGGYV